MDSDILKGTLITMVVAVIIYLITMGILNLLFPNPEKKNYEITLSGGKVIKSSFKDYSDRFENDSITFYKNQIVSVKEVK